MADISKIKVQGTDYNIKDATARNAKAFGTVTVGTTNIAADSASDTLTLAAGDNITLTPDAANGKITIAAKGTISGDSGGSGDYLTKTDPAGTGSFSMNRKAETEVGEKSVAFGESCTASGLYSHAEGAGSVAYGECSHAEGAWTVAVTKFQHTCGKYNVEDPDMPWSDKSNVFIIGNGMDNSIRSNAFRVTFEGAVIGKSAYQSTGADYAEMREWEDGNPNDEDRRGLFVTIHDDRISIAEPGDFIEGIVSGHPCVIGNFDEAWQGQFLRDEFNDYIKEDVEAVDPVTGGKETVKWYKVNPDYDKDQPYIQRMDRPEWDAVGMMGHLRVKDDGTCEPNGYCINTTGGIATKAEKGYRVVKRITENVVEIVFSMYANF